MQFGNRRVADELKLSVNAQLKNQGGTFKTQVDLTIHSLGMDNRQGRLLANGKLLLMQEQVKLIRQMA